MTKEFMTVKEVADKLGFTTHHIGKMLNSGELPGYRMGHNWRINTQALEAWIEERCNTKKTG